MTIEVGDKLVQSGNGAFIEWTVTHLGRFHGICVTKFDTEMSFHIDRLTADPAWKIVKPMPEVKTHYYVIATDLYPEDDGSLQIVSDGAVAAWEFVRDYPTMYSGVVRVNPDHTWDYVNENGDVQS